MTALNELTREPLVFTTGTTQPSLYDVVTGMNGAPVEMVPGTSAVFFMRPLLSRAPDVSAAAVPLYPADDNGNNVRYDWASGDLSVEGPYMGWWGYELPGSSLIETPEFRVVITDHGPGFGAQIGAIVDGVAQFMPITLDRLRQDSTFGDRFLQRHADYIKRIVLGTVVAPDIESTYDIALQEYLSKRVAVRLISPAKDYWARQYRTVQTQGPSEMAAYPDMLANLDVLCSRLSHELVHDWRQLQRLVPNLPQLRVEPMPFSTLGDPVYRYNRAVTPDPQIQEPAQAGGPHWLPWFQF